MVQGNPQTQELRVYMRVNGEKMRLGRYSIKSQEQEKTNIMHSVKELNVLIGKNTPLMG